MPDKSLGEQMFESAAKGWRNLWGAENLPSDKRIYMESVIDKRRDPITEKSFTQDELNGIRNVIVKRYDRIKPQLQQELQDSRARANEALKNAYGARNVPGMKRIYMDQYRAEAENIRGLSDFFSKGVLNPVVVLLAKLHGVKPNIQQEYYENNGLDPTLRDTLGAFTYAVDNNGNITIKDAYDFNNKAAAVFPLKPTDLLNPQNAAYSYGARVLPEGKGRPVTIRVNSMAPPKPKKEPNWFSKAASYFGF